MFRIAMSSHACHIVAETQAQPSLLARSHYSRDVRSFMIHHFLIPIYMPSNSSSMMKPERISSIMGQQQQIQKPQAVLASCQYHKPERTLLGPLIPRLLCIYTFISTMLDEQPIKPIHSLILLGLHSPASLLLHLTSHFFLLPLPVPFASPLRPKRRTTLLSFFSFFPFVLPSSWVPRPQSVSCKRSPAVLLCKKEMPREPRNNRRGGLSNVFFDFLHSFSHSITVTDNHAIFVHSSSSALLFSPLCRNVAVIPREVPLPIRACQTSLSLSLLRPSRLARSRACWAPSLFLG